MVNNLVFRWPKPLFFMVLGAHGRGDYNSIYKNQGMIANAIGSLNLIAG